MISYKKQRLGKYCVRCSQRFIPKGRSQKLCEECHTLASRGRKGGK